MKPDKTKTAVIFRAFRDRGDVIALFPYVPADNAGWNCESYQRVGQHGGADPHIVRVTRKATPGEICDLACELRGLGYKLRALERFPANAYVVRKQALILK